MKKIPSAIFIVDIKKEDIAVREALKLRIPIFAVVDTNCDPTEIDYTIPGNDDSTKSITIISRIIADAILEGRESLKVKALEEAEMAAKKEKPADKKEHVEAKATAPKKKEDKAEVKKAAATKEKKEKDSEKVEAPKEEKKKKTAKES
jgi:small subunit ribosomal protein S2